MTTNQSVIAVYLSHHAAEDAVKQLQKSGFDMKKLSIIGKDFHSEDQVCGYYNAGDRIKFWGKLGAFWGGLWGLLFGSLFIFVPVIGHVVVLGPLAAAIAGVLEGAVLTGGITAIGAALMSIGIPKDSVLKYETEVKSEKFLLIAHGTKDDIYKAKQILDVTKADEIALFSE